MLQQILISIRHRLEAATSRLEDIADSTDRPNIPVLDQAVPPPPNNTSVAPTPPVAPSVPKPVAEPLPESIEDFDAFLNSSVDKYVQASNELGGLVAQQVRLPSAQPSHDAATMRRNAYRTAR